jgi:hypothetical protein
MTDGTVLDLAGALTAIRLLQAAAEEALGEGTGDVVTRAKLVEIRDNAEVALRRAQLVEGGS